MYEGLDQAAHQFRLAAANPQSLQMLAKHYMQMGYPAALVLSMAQQAKQNAAKQSAPIMPGQQDPTTVAQDTLGMAQGGLAGSGMQQPGYAEGGAVQGDVRKVDRYSPSEMPSSERRRVENEAFNDWKKKMALSVDRDTRSTIYTSTKRFGDLMDDKPYQYAGGGKVDDKWRTLDLSSNEPSGHPDFPYTLRPVDNTTGTYVAPATRLNEKEKKQQDDAAKRAIRMAHGGPVGLNNIAMHRIMAVQKANKATAGKMPVPQMDQRQGVLKKGFAGGGLVSFAEGGPTGWEQLSQMYVPSGAGASPSNGMTMLDAIRRAQQISQGPQRTAPTMPDTPMQMPTGAYNGYEESYPSGTPVPGGVAAALAGAGGSPVAAPRSAVAPAGGGIGSLASQMDQLKPYMGTRPGALSVDQAMSDQAAMRKAAGLSDHPYDELKTEAGVRQAKQVGRAEEGRDTSQAMALLSAASGMMDVRTQGLGGLLQGLGLAAKAGVPVAMEGDKEYRKSMETIEDKYAQAMAAYKKGDIDEAKDRVKEAFQSIEKSKDRVEKYDEKMAGIAGQLGTANVQGQYHLAGQKLMADAHTASAGKNGPLELIRALADDPKLAAAYAAAHGVDAKEITAASGLLKAFAADPTQFDSPEKKQIIQQATAVMSRMLGGESGGIPQGVTVRRKD